MSAKGSPAGNHGVEWRSGKWRRPPAMLREMRVTHLIASGVDQIARTAMAWRSPQARRRSRAESLGPSARVDALAQIAAFYNTDAHLRDADAFFGAPQELRIDERRRDGARDLSWESSFEPLAVRDDYLALRENRRAHARWIPHPRSSGRDVAILLHGYRGGGFSFEARFGERALYEAMGLDTILFVLPHHGARGVPGRAPRFPASDPRVTNEALRQAIWDLRNLMAHLRRAGVERIAVHGTSLGGYTAALLGTVEPVDALVPMIPLASFADVALESGRFVGTRDEQRLQHAGLEAAHRSVSPFARPPRVPPERVIVVGGEVDRVTGMDHARKVQRHYEAELTTFTGGHIVQLGKSRARARVIEKLHALGLGRA